MKILIFTQVRVGSTRFPGKVLKPLGLGTVLSTHIERLKKSQLCDGVVVLTTREEGVDPVLDICRDLGIDFFQGSTDDVLDRYFQAAKHFAVDLVLRVTSDCPLIDPELLDDLVLSAKSGKYDIVSNNFKATLPHGFDAELFTFEALKRAWSEGKSREDREHVSTFIRKNCDINGGNLFKAKNLEYDPNFKTQRFTLDYEEDLLFFESVVSNLGTKKSWNEYAQFVSENEQIFNLNNMHIKLNR